VSDISALDRAELLADAKERELRKDTVLKSDGYKKKIRLSWSNGLMLSTCPLSYLQTSLR
jgi:hypothetical protein